MEIIKQNCTNECILNFKVTRYYIFIELYYFMKDFKNNFKTG